MDTIFLKPLNKYFPLMTLVKRININLSTIEYGTKRFQVALQCSTIINMLITYVNMPETNTLVESYFAASTVGASNASTNDKQATIAIPSMMSKEDGDVFMSYYIWLRTICPSTTADDVFRFDNVWTLLSTDIRNDIISGLSQAVASKNKCDGLSCKEVLKMMSFVYNPFKLRYVLQQYLEEIETNTVRSGDFEYVAKCIAHTVNALSE